MNLWLCCDVNAASSLKVDILKPSCQYDHIGKQGHWGQPHSKGKTFMSRVLPFILYLESSLSTSTMWGTARKHQLELRN